MSDRVPHVPFVHHVRPRYAEIDVQGIVFNAHWLTYFDEASTRYFAAVLGRSAPQVFGDDFDVMVVKATLEWEGPARFEDDVAIAVEPTRVGTSSFDLTYAATANGDPACVGTITYVSVVPGTHTSTPIPDLVRAALATRPPP